MAVQIKRTRNGKTIRNVVSNKTWEKVSKGDIDSRNGWELDSDVAPDILATSTPLKVIEIIEKNKAKINATAANPVPITPVIEAPKELITEPDVNMAMEKQMIIDYLTKHNIAFDKRYGYKKLKQLYDENRGQAK